MPDWFLRLLCAATVFVMSAPALPAADQARVGGETLQVHAQPSSQSKVIGTVAKNEAVTIDFQLSSPQGAWCMIRTGAIAGYVRCQQLVRTPARAKVVAARPEPRTLYNETCGNGRGDAWRERYNLTAAQLSAAQSLAEKLGVLKCGQKAAQFQQAFHSVGTSAQTMDALKNEWWARERQDHCGDQLELFLQQLQTLVSPQQKQLLENDRKEVHRFAMTGQVPLFCAY